MGYGAANDGVRQRIAAEMALGEPRAKPVADVARAPRPHERPDHAQWDEVAQRWEVWDEEHDRWVALDDGSVQEPGTPSGPPADPTVPPPLEALLSSPRNRDLPAT